MTRGGPERPGLLLHLVWISLVLMLLGLVVGAAWLEVDQVVRATGRVLATDLASPLLAPLPGRIAQVYVQDGDRVRRGDRLVTIAPEPSLPAQDEARLRWVRAAARARAYAGSQASAQPDDATLSSHPEDAAIRHAVEESMTSEHQARQAQRRAQAQDLSMARAALAVEAAGRGRALALLPLVKDKLSRNERLTEEGFLSAGSLIPIRQEWVEAQEQVALAEARVQRAAAEVAVRQANLDLLVAEQRRSLAERSEEAQQQSLLAQQELVRMRDLHGSGVVQAPLDGVVEQLSPQLAGNILRAGDRLMAIAPAATRYEIHLRVRNEDYPYLQIGQSVDIKFDAYPYTVHGSWSATVLRLAREPLAGGEGPEGAPDYAVVAVFREPDRRETDQALPALRTGMRVQADIRVGRRRPLDIWLDPFIRLGREALRERR